MLLLRQIIWCQTPVRGHIIRFIAGEYVNRTHCNPRICGYPVLSDVTPHHTHTRTSSFGSPRGFTAAQEKRSLNKAYHPHISPHIVYGYSFCSVSFSRLRELFSSFERMGCNGYRRYRSKTWDFRYIVEKESSEIQHIQCSEKLE